MGECEICGEFDCDIEHDPDDCYDDDAEELSEILGHNLWRSLACDECGVDANAIVEIGEEPDYESATARACLDCINKAVKLLT